MRRLLALPIDEPLFERSSCFFFFSKSPLDHRSKSSHKKSNVCVRETLNKSDNRLVAADDAASIISVGFGKYQYEYHFSKLYLLYFRIKGWKQLSIRELFCYKGLETKHTVISISTISGRHLHSTAFLPKSIQRSVAKLVLSAML